MFSVLHKRCALCKVCNVSWLGAFLLIIIHPKHEYIYLQCRLKKESTKAKEKNTRFISLFICISGNINDLICRQRRHLCKANVRRHQSFHHHGEPLRPKASLEKRIFRLLIAWHVSLGYLKALEVQCEVIIVLQAFEKKCGLNISDLSSGGAALTSSRAASRWSYWDWVSDPTYWFPFFSQSMACCLTE